MKLEKYLPIGSVVLLDGGETKVMITGFVASAEDENEVYDYCALTNAAACCPA